MIEVEKITKVYGNKKNRFVALKDVSLKVEDGSSLAILGKSGSGKSTLMHAISGLDMPQKGKVIIDGQDIGSLKQKLLDQFRAEKIGFIFQSFFVQGNETCFQNVAMPLEISKVKSSQRKKRVKKALKMVGLSDKINQKAKNLSGGQKQRLAIARAIVSEPRIIFADEPTGNLDSTTGTQIEDLLFGINKKTGSTLIIVTHDEDLAKRCQRQIMIRDGKVVSDSAQKATKPKKKPRVQKKIGGLV